MPLADRMGHAQVSQYLRSVINETPEEGAPADARSRTVSPMQRVNQPVQVAPQQVSTRHHEETTPVARSQKRVAEHPPARRQLVDDEDQVLLQFLNSVAVPKPTISDPSSAAKKQKLNHQTPTQLPGRITSASAKYDKGPTSFPWDSPLRPDNVPQPVPRRKNVASRDLEVSDLVASDEYLANASKIALELSKSMQEFSLAMYMTNGDVASARVLLEHEMDIECTYVSRRRPINTCSLP